MLKKRTGAKKIFLICPVRDVSLLTRGQIEQYVGQLEKEGCSVYWPERDADQTDQIGLAICKANRKALHEADEIHIWYDMGSQGSVFDFGMTFAFMLVQPKKRLIIANPREVIQTSGKSFQNVLFAINGKTNSEL